MNILKGVKFKARFFEIDECTLGKLRIKVYGDDAVLTTIECEPSLHTTGQLSVSAQLNTVLTEYMSENELDMRLKGEFRAIG